MSDTGYSSQRARFHDALVEVAVEKLAERGYEPELLPVDGDRPDVRIIDLDGRVAYIDFKTAPEDQPRFAIKIGSLETYERYARNGHRVYIAWAKHEVRVDTVESLIARIHGGPHRATGRGSNTDWLLIEPGGTLFDKFFPERL